MLQNTGKRALYKHTHHKRVTPTRTDQCQPLLHDHMIIQTRTQTKHNKSIQEFGYIEKKYNKGIWCIAVEVELGSL
jgi:hypothetical protein